jgi:hypothetical protein
VSESGAEIVVEPDEPPDESAALAQQRTVEMVTLGVILGFAVLMGWDNWKTGISWEPTGPAAGYFPFWVSVILGGACLFGLATEWMKRRDPGEAFVTRNQFKRVLQMFIPTFLYVPVTQWLGLYVASFILIAGFMIVVGHIKAWKSLLTAFIFSALMFATFDVAFDVIMPKGPLERLFGY